MNEKEFNDLVARVGEAAALKIKEQTEAMEKKNSEAMEELKTKNETLESALKEQGRILKEMQENPARPKMETIGDQIKAWREENKDALAQIKAGQKAELTPMHIKAVSIPMTIGVNAPDPTRLYFQNGAQVIDLVRNKPTFWSRLNKPRTSLAAFTWVDKVNKQGNAAFIGEGVVKPLASFDLSPQVSVPKKVAESMKVSNEMLFDIPRMQTLIEDELRYEVEMAANTAVLTGTLSSTSPAGVTTIASAFTLTTIKTTNPNFADVLRAAIAQLISLNFDRNLTIFINPIDAANMDLTKATDSGVYMLPPFTTADGRIIAGVPVIEDNNIAVGHFLAGDMTRYHIEMYQDYFVAWGWENDDFRKNLMTVIGEMRFHQYVSQNEVGAFIYDTFTAVQTAITAV